MVNFGNLIKLSKQVGIFVGVLASVVSIVTGVVKYINETSSRQEMLHATAWSLVAQNKNGNAGLRWAMELLARDKIEMRSLHFSEVDLSATNLRNAKLSYSTLERSNIHASDLSGADLSNSNLRCSTLADTVFFNANLKGANFSGANVTRADFRNSAITKAQLNGITCINFDEKNTSLLPKVDFEINEDMFIKCPLPKNGIRQCLEPS